MVQYQNLLEFPRTVLVTGATGFVGSQLVRALLNCNQRVVALGRNPIRLPIEHPNLQFRFADFNQSLQNFVDDKIDLVYHVAAQTSPWGRWRDYQKANVDATESIVQASLAAQVKRFVHVSSTAVQFDFRDRTDVLENEPLPKKFACEYARSKAVAERIVQKGVQQGLPAITIRARAVFGKGDRSLFPRLFRAAQAGRLPIIGDGFNRIDLTYIDNLVQALLLAATEGKIGSTYTITNDDPVLIWQVIQQMSNALDFKTPKIKRLPYRLASGLASGLELIHRAIPGLGEPKLTRYTVGLLAKTQIFDITAAKNELGYRPIVSMKDAISRTQHALTALTTDSNNNSTNANVFVRLRMFSTGYTNVSSRFVTTCDQTAMKQRFHAPFAILEHPKYGISLIDTGYSIRFYEATKHWPAKMYSLLTPVVTKPAWSAASWLKRLGITISDVKRIVITHFHADHVGGLLDFPEAEIITSKAASDCFRRYKGIRALKRAFLPGHVPDDLDRRSRLIDQYDDPGIGEIDKCHDLFEDGSVRLFDVSGHATGQLGLLLQTGSNSRVLHAADAAWTTQSILRNEDFTWAFHLTAASKREAIQTRIKLHQVTNRFPDIELFTSHCPQVATHWKFDEQLQQLDRETSAT